LDNFITRQKATFIVNDKCWFYSAADFLFVIDFTAVLDLVLLVSTK